MKKLNPQKIFRTERSTYGFATRPARRGRSFCLRAVLLVFIVTAGCTGVRDQAERFEARGERARSLVDSVFAASGWPDSLSMAGKVTIDVKQYHVKGRFRLVAPADGDFTFEFSGTMVMGGHHEDVVVSYIDDVVRILDRERGRYYEGEETNSLVSEGVGIDLDLAELLRRVVLRTPAENGFSGVSLSDRGGDGVRLHGELAGKDFYVDNTGGVVQGASWPVVRPGALDDRMTLVYDWETGSAVDNGIVKPVLRRLILVFEGRRWRIKLEAE